MNLKILCPKQGNFGDELNLSLFNKLLGSVFLSEKYNNVDFYGIGTILTNRIGRQNRCVVFGTGVRDITCSYDKGNWDVFFLRGPVSSNVLGYNGAKYITDAAYAIMLVDSMIPSLTPKYPISIVPHWSHMDIIDWNCIARQTDIHVIDPRKGVNKVIGEIVQSKRIIASAMHGAILADICRIPWLRMRLEIFPHETSFDFDLKWKDWLYSMSLSEKFLTLRNMHVQYNHDKDLLAGEIIKELKNIQKGDHLYQLSSDLIFGNKINCIANEVDKFLNFYI